MFWYVLLGFFAAFGVFCAVWTVFGGLYPGRAGCELTLRCPKDREMALLKHLCWLREMGLLHMNLTVVDSGLTCRQQQMISEKYPFIKFEEM